MIKEKPTQFFARIPESLHQQLKIRAAELKITMQQALILALKKWIDKK